MNHSDKENWSMSSLFADLTDNLTSLVRHEVTLAKSEMNSKVKQIGAGGVFVAAGGAVLMAGFLVLLASAVIGLAHVLPLWLSALAIGAAVSLIGVGLMLKGRSDLKAESLTPHRTISSMRQNIDFTKEQFGRAS